MLFRDIKQNFPVYILDKASVELVKGKVTATTFPHPKNNNQNGFNMPNNSYGTVVPPLSSSENQRMVLDLTIEVDGRSATYEVSENASVNYAGSLILATEQSLLAPEVEAIYNAADQGLAPERINQLKQQRDKSKALLAEINPAFKQQQEYDQRFNKLESSVGELKDMMKNFIKELKS